MCFHGSATPVTDICYKPYEGRKRKNYCQFLMLKHWAQVMLAAFCCLARNTQNASEVVSYLRMIY
jgi:hypothetical protein